MKHFYIFLFLLTVMILPSAAQAYTSDDFVMTIDTTQVVVGPTNEFTLPTTGNGYDAIVDWGDGSTTTLSGTPGNVTHIYPVPGVYEIVITPNTPTGFPQIFFAFDTNPAKLLTIEQWGISQWRSMDRAFANCDNLTITATDAPNLSNVIDMSDMFNSADGFNSDINNWDVSNVTDMSHLFDGATSFNQSLNSWNVSSVENMEFMFRGATAFNQPLDMWDVSNVTTMDGMFLDATSFNQSLNSWNVANVIYFGCYGECESGMFQGATAFNQPLNNWDVSSAQSMDFMFQGATAFNQPLNNWDISSVMNNIDSGMRSMFDDSGLSSENYSTILNAWAALPALQNNVTLGAEGIIYLETASTARQYLIETYNWTINDAGPYLEPSNDTFITVWDTRLDENTADELSIYLDSSASAFTIDWGDGTSQYYATGPGNYVTHTYSTPGVKTVTITGDFPYFYAGCYDGDEYNKLIDVVQWGTGVWESFSSSFSGCTYLESFSATDTPDLSQVTDMSSMFYTAVNFNGNIGNWDVSNVSNMSCMFCSDSTMAFNQDISNWNVANVTNMGAMFWSEAGSLFNQDLSAWDVSSATDLSYLFHNTALSTSNYSKILNAWSALTLQDSAYYEEGTGVGPQSGYTPYCSNVQASRDILTNTYNWSITDGGPVSCTTATYLTSAGGTLIGDTFQYIVDGESGTAVSVVPADGYRFVSWSDGSTANPRIDSNLASNISVTAILEAGDGASSGNSTAIGIRAERLGEMIVNTPVVASITTFVSSVRDFLDFLTQNEDEIEQLTPAERTQVITALRDIIAFLLKLVPGV